MGPTQKYDTREAWLVAAIEGLRPMFAEAGFEIPAVRISCSWPSKTIRKTLGQCWSSKASTDGSRQMFITPRLADGFKVLEITVHELLHACLPDDAGHKAPFKRGMKKLDLVGKPTSTNAGEKLAKRLHAVSKSLGVYPHAALSLGDPMAKKQGTRMLKLECPDCGYVVRTTAKWINTGLPVCVCGETFKLEHI